MLRFETTPGFTDATFAKNQDLVAVAERVDNYSPFFKGYPHANGAYRFWLLKATDALFSRTSLAFLTKERPKFDAEVPLDIIAGPRTAVGRDLADACGTAPGADARFPIAGDAIGETTFPAAHDLDGNVLRRFGNPGLKTVIH